MTLPVRDERRGQGCRAAGEVALSGFRRSAAATLLSLLVLLLGVSTGAVRMAAQADPVHITFWNYWDGTNGDVMQSMVDR